MRGQWFTAFRQKGIVSSTTMLKCTEELILRPTSLGSSGLILSRFHTSVLMKSRDETVATEKNIQEFRKLELYPTRARAMARRRREQMPVPPPRYKKMPLNQDWPSVWPTARTFHPASVPLPMHQGYVKGDRATPNKFGNLELMKIPNFLHLTPPAIRRQCEAIKKFCTPWPTELKTNDDIDINFPIQITTNDYCHSSPTIRDARARIVTLQVKLADLNLDFHARDKMLRLVGDRYDAQSDFISIVTDCCPVRKQNYDYAMYLLTALYHESKSKESWEEKEESDMEYYVWEGSASHKVLEQFKNIKISSGEPVVKEDAVKDYVSASCKLHNEGENLDTVTEYAQSVRKLFNLPSSI